MTPPEASVASWGLAMMSVTPAFDVRYPRTCDACGSPWLAWSTGVWFQCLLCGARRRSVTAGTGEDRELAAR
jgi:hypothetical protein